MNKIRAPTMKAQTLAGTSECVKGFIEYCIAYGTTTGNQKWRDTNASTVLKNLIEIMVFKGFGGLSMPRLEQFIRQIDMNPNFSRDHLFKEIAFWCQQTLPPLAAKAARNKLTI